MCDIELCECSGRRVYSDFTAKWQRGSMKLDENCGDSTRFDVIREHIAMHTLNPTARVGMMLRELLELKDRMRGDLHKTDANGHCHWAAYGIGSKDD